jgi:hypothetical protein
MAFNSKEGAVYTNCASDPDPAADDYTYYLNNHWWNYRSLQGLQWLEGNSLSK